MALVSMNVKDDANDAPGGATADSDYDRSPTIYLSDAQVKALGIQGVKAGTVLRIEASAKVDSVSHRDDGDSDDPDVTVSLTLTHMAADAPESATPKATLLYGG